MVQWTISSDERPERKRRAGPAVQQVACSFAHKKTGAGDGNRTHVCSLGSCRSTIELHPQPLRDSTREVGFKVAADCAIGKSIPAGEYCSCRRNSPRVFVHHPFSSAPPLFCNAPQISAKRINASAKM